MMTHVQTEHVSPSVQQHIEPEEKVVPNALLPLCSSRSSDWNKMLKLSFAQGSYAQAPDRYDNVRHLHLK